jgi:acyl carrier protein
VLGGAGEPAAEEGAEGELYLGGVQVARGYLGRPELTAERFLPDPFSGEAGARLYRTGDLVRVLPGGALEWLERLDGQAKVRGFRIEPGEVEAALLRCAGVREAAAAVRRYAPGDTRLVGYAVPREGARLAGAALRRALAAELPEHLVPSAVVVLDALPLTPGGKTDRAALPAPALAGAAEYVAPRTATEERLAEIWREVLRVERVGAGDHFFDLGGHSLLATQVASRVRVRLGVEIAIQQLFDTPRLAALAAFVDAAEEALVAALLADIEGLSDEEAGALYLSESAPHSDAAPSGEGRP